MFTCRLHMGLAMSLQTVADTSRLRHKRSNIRLVSFDIGMGRLRVFLVGLVSLIGMRPAQSQCELPWWQFPSLPPTMQHRHLTYPTCYLT